VLTLTEAASRKLADVLASSRSMARPSSGQAQRTSGCCSGPQYGLSLAERTQDGDWVGDSGGIKLLVDPDSAPLLKRHPHRLRRDPAGLGLYDRESDAQSARQTSEVAGRGLQLWRH